MTPARWSWVAVHVAATFLAFPHPLPFAGGPVLDLGWAVAWLVPASLILALEDLPMRSAVRTSFLATVVAHGLVLHFIYVVTVRYGHAPAAVGVLAPFLLAMYPGVLGGLFGLAWVWLRRRGAAGPFGAALLWTALDYLRSMALTGWPWATLGYAQHENAALMALAQYTGVYGLSFAVALGGAAAAFVFRALRAGRAPAPVVWAAIGGVVALHGAGLALGARPSDVPGAPETVRIAAIQGNIDQGVKWNAAWIDQTLAYYEDLSRQASAAGAEVIVWPETAVPGALELDPAMRARIVALARETAATFVVGSVGVDADRGSARIARFYDSAFVLSEEDGIVERYDKSHLVPFGEYVPLRWLLGRLFGAVASGIARGDVTAGEGPRAVELALGGGSRGGLAPRRTLKVAIPICYELLFPDLVRRFVADGGRVLLAMTNDAWYGRTGAPYQFLAITAMRAAETRTWVVRAANTGVSATIDSGGWVREETPIFERRFLVADVPLLAASGDRTFYVRYGDVFARSCCLALAACGGLAWRRGRARAGGPAATGSSMVKEG